MKGVAGVKDLKQAMPKRSPYSSKSDNGRVLIVGGNDRFHGAPVLASVAAYDTLAALRVGAGYAVTCVPKGIAPAVRGLSANIIVRPLSGEIISMKDLPVLRAEAEKADAVVVGMGVGRGPGSLLAIAGLVGYCVKARKPTVVDADAIFAIRYVHGGLSKRILLTPNERELAELGKDKVGKEINSRVKAAKRLAQKLGATVLLKGHDTVITDGARVRIVRSKSAALATMGTGDVLSGIIGGFMAGNGDVFLCGVAAAYLHSRIGDTLHAKKGNHALASDVVDLIPEILKHLDGQ